jgi:hypothetical protein
MAWVGPPGDELLAQIADSDNRLDIYRTGQQAAKKMGITLEPHPEWGGFRLGRCSSFEADVDVWRCEVQRVDGKAQRSCVDLTTTVAWVDGDWKLRHYAIPAEPPSPEVSPDPVLGEAPLPAAARRRALTEAGNGWQEFANAPR